MTCRGVKFDSHSYEPGKLLALTGADPRSTPGDSPPGDSNGRFTGVCGHRGGGGPRNFSTYQRVGFGNAPRAPPHPPGRTREAIPSSGFQRF